MTTTLDIDMTAWKQEVYEKLTQEEIDELKKIIQGAVRGAGFVTGKLYLLPDKPVSSSESACR
ncbi:MAG: hypothetical protein ACW97P_10640 [Candidatus Hodarchaeales archaeon]